MPVRTFNSALGGVSSRWPRTSAKQNNKPTRTIGLYILFASTAVVGFSVLPAVSDMNSNDWAILMPLPSKPAPRVLGESTGANRNSGPRLERAKLRHRALPASGQRDFFVESNSINKADRVEILTNVTFTDCYLA